MFGISLAALRNDVASVSAVVGALVTIVGVFVADFSTGPLHMVGHVASIVAPVLATILVLVQRVQEILGSSTS